MSVYFGCKKLIWKKGSDNIAISNISKKCNSQIVMNVWEEFTTLSQSNQSLFLCNRWLFQKITNIKSEQIGISICLIMGKCTISLDGTNCFKFIISIDPIQVLITNVHCKDEKE